MSTWGGIGEGIAEGLKERMDREDKLNKERREQANADRQFEFAQQQAAQAQANADRSYEANRADAAQAQANADRTFAAGREDAARSQANADRSFAAAENQRGIENERADYELALKGEDQDWKNQLNAQNLRQLQSVNDELDAKRRKREEKERLVATSGYKQTALASQRLLNGMGTEGTITLNGQQQKASILQGEDLVDIFGADNPWLTDPKTGINSMALIHTDAGDRILTTYNNGKTSLLDTDSLYAMAKDAWDDEGVANAMFGKQEQKRQMGVFTQQENIKATAKEKARESVDPYGSKRKIDSANAIVKAYQADPDSVGDEAYHNAISYLASVYSGASKNSSREELEKERKRLIEQKQRLAVKKGGVKQAATTQTATPAPKKEDVGGNHDNQPKKDSANKEEKPKKSPIPTQRSRRHGDAVSHGSAFEVNETAVAANAKREQEEEEKRERDREEFYRRMNGANKVASVGKRHN